MPPAPADATTRASFIGRTRSLVWLTLMGVGVLAEVRGQEGVPVVTPGRVRLEEGEAGTTTARLPVYLSAPSTAPVSVSWSTADGTATSPQDYTTASGPLVFEPGEVVRTIPVSILGDGEDEHDETVMIVLSNVIGGVLGEPVGHVLIVADEPVTAIALPGSPLAFESRPSMAQPLFQIGHPVPTRTARGSVISGSATAGVDVELSPASGVLDLSQSTSPLPIQLINDALEEPDETYQFQVSETSPGVRLLPGAPDMTVEASPTLKDLVVDGDTLAAIDGTSLTIWRRGAGGWQTESVIDGAAEGGVSAIALDGGRLAADFPATGVKLYERVGGIWSVVATLPRLSTEPDTTRALDLQDDTLAIGDPAPPGREDASGRVWIHERHAGGAKTWGLQATIDSPVLQPDFGAALALWGDALAIGSPDAHSVALFLRSAETRQWSMAKELVRFLPGFGREFDLDGSLLVAPTQQQWITLQRQPADGTWIEKAVTFPSRLAVGSPVFLRGGVVCGTSGNSIRFMSRPPSPPWSFAGAAQYVPQSSPLASLFAFDGHTLVRAGAPSATSLPLLIQEPTVMQGGIIDDETIRFTIDDRSTDTGGANNAYYTTVHLSRPLPLPVSVTVEPRPGTALPDSDYIMSPLVAAFEPDQMSQLIGFNAYPPAPGDGLIESFSLRLTDPTAGSVGPDATITIVPPSPIISFISGTFVPEGDSGTTPATITLKLSGPAPEGASYRWRIDSSSDALSSSVVDTTGVVAVPAGATTSSFEILVKGDTQPEGTASLLLRLEETVKLGRLEGDAVYLVIQNDDTGTPVDDSFSFTQGGFLSGVNVMDNDLGVGIPIPLFSPLNGTFTLDADGSLNYQSPPNFFGRELFWYREGYDIPDVPPLPAKVVIDVLDGGRPPVIKPDAPFNVMEETTLDRTFSSTDSLFNNDGLFDLSGVAYDPILESRVVDVQNGVVTDFQGLTGLFKFTPAPDFAGSAGFRYQVRDKDGWSEPALVSIQVIEDLVLGPMQPVGPPGSQLFLATTPTARVPVSGSIDQWITLRAGQTVSVRVGNSTTSPAVGRLELLDAAGVVLPGGLRSTNALENVPVPADGAYKLIIGEHATGGSQFLSVLVNGGLPAQPTIADTPYPLDAARPGDRLRAAVYTTTSTTTLRHYYSFAATAGETVRLHLQSTAAQAFYLQDPGGFLVGLSTPVPGDDKSASLEYTIVSPGTHSVRVDGLRNTSYSLLLYRDSHSYDHLGGGPPPLVTAAAGALDGRGMPEVGPPGASLRFAAFADYGSGTINEAAVAAMVKSWQPDFLIAAGDHNYTLNYQIGDPSWSRNVGAFYGEFIKGRLDNLYPEQTSPTQRFFTAPGNHDSGPDAGNGGELSSYLDYFHSNPGAEPRLPTGVHQPRLSYYKFSQGPADFFMLDSDNAVVNSTAREVQRDWLRAQIAASTARWKFAVWHHPPFSSGTVHGNHPGMQWGEDLRGLTAIITGHEHIYERLDIGHGVTQFITGIGGGSIYDLKFTPVPESRVRYNASHGALRGVIGQDGVRIEFRAVGPPNGRLIDSLTVGTPPPGMPLATGRDTWLLPVRPGQILRLATRTPPPPGNLPHDINPALELLDATGTVVATATDGAADGRNAVLVHAIPASPDDVLTWSVRVMNEAEGTGDYELGVESLAADSFGAWVAARAPAGATGPEDDPDFDGLPNLLEFLGDTDPARAAQPPVPPLEMASDGSRSLRIHLPSDWTRPVTAQLQSSASLTPDGWVTLATKTAGGLWTSNGAPIPTPHPNGGFLFALPEGSPAYYRLSLALDEDHFARGAAPALRPPDQAK